MPRRILIVDDDRDFRRGLGLLLERKNLSCESVESGHAALEALKHRHFDIVFTDLNMPGMDGLDLLRTIKRNWPQTAVLVITGFGTIETAVDAMSEGAHYYVTKPFNNHEITVTVDRVLREQQIEDELELLRAEVTKKRGFGNLLGRDRQMVEVFELISKVGSTNVPVLVCGETGTGKELVAQAIHYEGARSKRPFVGLNASALPDSLLEAELFGSRKGAFTGADRDRKGLLVKASEGTLFLDEIGNMSNQFQNKLLRMLQEKEVTPLGSSDSIKVDVRVIAATNIDLGEEVRAGRFREDLFYRLNVIQIRLPPLREREGDVPLLAEHFIEKYCVDQGCSRKRLTPAALRVLTTYSWPGNVRELENVISRALIIADGDELTHRDIILEHERFSSDGSSAAHYGLPYDQAKERAIEAFQRDYVARVLSECSGNISRAAEKSGITRAALRRIIHRHQISAAPTDPRTDD